MGPFTVMPTCHASMDGGTLVVEPVICLITDRGTAVEQRWPLTMEQLDWLLEQVAAARFQAPQIADRMSKELRGDVTG